MSSMKRPAEGPPEGRAERFLLYGSKGWIGSLLAELLTTQGADFAVGTARLEDRAAIRADIERVQPTRILNAAGVTGRPNVDWCETNKQTCVRGNVLGTLNLADVCEQEGIHMTYFGTGCIFHYDEKFPQGSNKVGFYKWRHYRFSPVQCLCFPAAASARRRASAPRHLNQPNRRCRYHHAASRHMRLFGADMDDCECAICTGIFWPRPSAASVFYATRQLARSGQVREQAGLRCITALGEAASDGLAVQPPALPRVIVAIQSTGRWVHIAV